ncbi:MAG: hypothetical protein ABFD45_03015 [Smithella sp.]|jgi:hypothetical protein
MKKVVSDGNQIDLRIEESKAATRHTGAMAGNYAIWAAAVRQHGALPEALKGGD